MSWFEHAAKGLEMAAHHVGKHVTAENIARGGEEIRKGLNIASRELSKHVTAENIARGGEEIRNGINIAAQEVSKHVNAENIGKGIEELGKNWEKGAQGLGKAAENIHRHIQQAAAGTKDLVGEEAKGAIIEGASNGARRIVEIAGENPAAAVAVCIGVPVILVPAIITAPIMGVAGALGFGSSGILGASVASGLQAGIGNVAAGSTFAIFQSAAAGGYGLGMITGAVQAAAGTLVAAGGVGRLVSWWKR